MRTWWSGMLAAVALCGALLATAGAKQATEPPTLTSDQWRKDLKAFATELPKRHKNLFHSMTREQFERAVSELDAAIPELEAHQIIVRMKQITALVGDGHTGVHLPSYFRVYPIALFWFGPDLRVIAATKPYERALGARLVKVGTLTLDEVQSRIRTCLPSAENENEWHLMSSSPAMIVRADILHALGVVADRERASFTFEDEGGQTFSLEITPVAITAGAKGAPGIPGMIPAAAAQPLARQRPGERFWFTDLPEADLVYVNFRGYDSLGSKARELLKFLDSHPTRRLVIDLRQNDGGDFLEGRQHLVRPLAERPAINQEGRLYVIIGRRTFSAAMVNAIDFRKETHAVLIGEPIGERPNSYSENDEMTLPNSRLVISYSTRYYKFLDEDVPAVLPDVRIDPDWMTFKAGRDPVMEWILTAQRAPTTP